jgi:hypothetical protein
MNEKVATALEIDFLPWARVPTLPESATFSCGMTSK